MSDTADHTPDHPAKLAEAPLFPILPSRISRRDLLKSAGLLALAGAAPGQTRPKPRPPLPSTAQLNALALEPFVNPLYLAPLLAPTELRSGLPHGVEHARFYRIAMQATTHTLHRDLPPTHLYTYGEGPIGPLIEARRNQDVLIEWQNQLPRRHFLPVDYTLHGCGHDLPDSRAIVHVHGGRTPAASDGYPDGWYPTGMSRIQHYPNRQDAATLWYHDHAMGINRLNLYAGLMGIYLLRDEQEDALDLPRGPFELPLLLTDRNFDRAGQLLYPVSGDPEHPWVDDCTGDAMLVNSRIQPFHPVHPRPYRLRLVNGANARFFRLSLDNGTRFEQIGTDQGLLARPVPLYSLLLAPGERADVLVDFTSSAGTNVVLKNGALSLLQFRVSPRPLATTRATGGATPAARSISAPLHLGSVDPIPESSAVRTRRLTLDEFDDPTGRAMIMLLNRTHWDAPVTESPRLDTVEIWTLINLTEETHPIHLHHVRFQILDRRPFDRDHFLLSRDDLRYLGDAVPPRDQERGWKDVVQCPPGIVTRIIIPFSGSRGRYVWHCHVQEHEANDMMRPFEIV